MYCKIIPAFNTNLQYCKSTAAKHGRSNNPSRNGNEKYCLPYRHVCIHQCKINYCWRVHVTGVKNGEPVLYIAGTYIIYIIHAIRIHF